MAVRRRQVRGRDAAELGIGQVHAHHDLAFEPFHLVGLGVGLVIVADEVEKTMHREMGKMMQKNPVFIVAFALRASRRR